MANIPMKTLRLHGLDDTYTIPTAPEHIGAAPAGYGLGGNGQPVTISELSEIDNIKKNGQYAVNATSVVHIGGVATRNFTLEVSMFTDEVQGVTGAYGHQTIKLLGYNTILRRDCNNSVWGEFDWDNPPMHIGVEYRTTERWNGSPVYAKGINIGYLAAGSHSIAHNCAMVQPISCQVFNNSRELLEVYSGLSNITVSRTEVNLTCGNNFGDITVYLKYTK